MTDFWMHPALNTRKSRLMRIHSYTADESKFAFPQMAQQQRAVQQQPQPQLQAQPQQQQDDDVFQPKVTPTMNPGPDVSETFFGFL